MDSLVARIQSHVTQSEIDAEVLYKQYETVQPIIFVTSGPNWVDNTITAHENRIYEEIDCWVISAAIQVSLYRYYHYRTSST